MCRDGKVDRRQTLAARNRWHGRKKSLLSLLKSIQESEDLYRTMLDDIVDAVFLTDSDLNFTFICPNVRAIFGYNVEQVQALGNLERMLGEGLFDRRDLEARGELRNIERDVKTASGEARRLLVNVKQVSSRHGELLVTCHDVSDRRQVEKELAERAGELQDANHKLQTSLEELAVAEEELRVQNDTLAEAKAAAEAGRFRYQNLFEFSPDGSLVTDPEGIIREANQAAGVLLGMASLSLIGKPLSIYIEKEQRPEFFRSLARLEPGETLRDWEVNLKPRRGDPFPASISVAWTKLVSGDGEQTATYLRWNLRDIRKQKRAEALLRQQGEELQAAKDELEERVQARTAELAARTEELAARSQELAMRSQELAESNLQLDTSRRRIVEILESIRDGFFAIDREWRFTYINPRAANNSGFEPEELVGANIWEAFAGLLNTPLEQAYRQAMEHGLPATLEQRGINSDRWYTINVYPSAEGISVYWIDSTERKRAEQEREAHLTALAALSVQHAEARLEAEQMAAVAGQRAAELDAAFDAITDVILIYDGQGHLVRANQAARQLFGFDPEQLSMDEIAGRLEQRHPNGEPVPLEQLPARRALSGQRVVGERIIYKGAVGEMSMLVSASPLIHSQGAVTGVVAVWRDITDLEKAAALQYRLIDETLRQRALLETVIQADPGGLALIGSNLEIQVSNPAFQALIFSPQDEPAGRRLGEVWSETAKMFTEDQVRQVLETGKPLYVEGAEAYFPGQPPRSFTLRVIPVEWEGQRAALAAVWETTELSRARREAELAQRQADSERALLQAVIDNAPEGIVVTDAQGRILLTNPAARRLYDRPAPIGRPYTSHAVLQLCEPGGGPIDPRRLPLTRSALDGEILTEQELEILQPDGRRLPVIVNTAPIRDRQGKVTGAVGLFQDIRQRKEMEDRLGLALAALQESESRFRVALATAPVLVYTCDRDLRYTWAYNLQYGFTTEQVLGKRDDELLPAEDVAELMDFKRSTLERGAGDRREIRYRSPVGPVAFDITAEPLRDADGQVIGLTVAAFDITERKELEVRLRESEQLYKTMGDAIPYGVWLADEQGNMIYASQSFLDLLEMSQWEVQGLGWMQRLPPEEAGSAREAWLSCVRTGQDWEAEYRLLGPDGGYHTVLARGKPVRDAAGRIRWWVGIHLDIDERKRMEERLAFHALILEHVHDAVIATDERRTVTAWNRAAEELYGWTADQALGHPIGELIRTEGYGQEQDERAVERLAAEGQFRAEMVQYSRLGRRIYIESTTITLRDPSGRVTGYVSGAHDITARKLAEEALRRSEAIERAHSAELQAIMDAVPAYILVAHDPECREVTGSRSAYNLLGLPYGSNLTQTPTEAKQLPPFQVFSGGASEPGLLPLQLAASHGIEAQDVQQEVNLEDGRSLHLYGNVTPLLDERGRPAGAVAAFTDVTRLAQAESVLQAYASRLEDTNRELRDFAFIASHDLQEPLRKIQAFGDRLKKECGQEISPQGLDYLGRMQGAAGRMSEMITGLLAYSRVTTKARPFERVDLDRVAREVITDLEVRVERSGGQVVVAPLPVIEADPLQMRQLLQNLISNGLKFHRKGVAPVVRVFSKRTGERGEKIELMVEDNGIGFDEGLGERLFQPFSRLHGRSEYEGSGIGLAICRKIAERHRGRIYAQSRPGQGSVFTVELPVNQASKP